MFQRPFKAYAGRLAVAVGFLLQGCASAPAPSKPVAPPPVATHAPEQIIEMAPIPNPEPSRSARPAHGAAAGHRAASKTSKEEDEAAKGASHPQPVLDHAKAAKLRAQGLEELDRGRINRAVALLQTASQLDPGNRLIQRDLDRALRISRAVHSHP
jgi:hypothetical protein